MVELSPQRVESIEFVILATLTIAYAPFSRRGSAKTLRAMCVCAGNILLF